MVKLTKKDLQLVEEFRVYLKGFTKRALAKFKKGRQEHHDQDPKTLDCDFEIEQEEMDILAYNFIKSKQ